MFYSGQKQIFLLFFLRVFLRVFLMQLVTLDFCIYPEIKKIWRNRNSRYSWLVTTRISKAKYLRHSPLKWWRYFYYDGDCRIGNCIWLQKSIFFKFCIFLWNSVKKRAYGIESIHSMITKTLFLFIKQNNTLRRIFINCTNYLMWNIWLFKICKVFGS